MERDDSTKRVKGLEPSTFTLATSRRSFLNHEIPKSCGAGRVTLRLCLPDGDEVAVTRTDYRGLDRPPCPDEDGSRTAAGRTKSRRASSNEATVPRGHPACHGYNGGRCHAQRRLERRTAQDLTACIARNGRGSSRRSKRT